MLFSSPIIVWDTETTGLPRDSWAAVVDLGAVLVSQEGEIIGEFECLVLPEVLDERADFALSISGITPELLRAEGLTAQAALERVDLWMAGLPQEMTFHTSFNIAFDKPMMRRMGLEYPAWASCIMLKAQAAMNAGKWPKLKEAAPFFGVTQEEPAHRALADAKTAAKIMVEIQRRRSQ
jgi:DNA polymerase III epsilon subunit-like protein